MPRMPPYVAAGDGSYVVRLPRVPFYFWVVGAIMVTGPGSLVALAAGAGPDPLKAVLLLGGFSLLLLSPLACLFWIRDQGRARMAGRVVLAVDDAGIYLNGPPRRIGWPRVAEVVLFSQPHGDEAGNWDHRVVVLERGPDGSFPQPLARRPLDPSGWGQVVALCDARLRLADLATAVHEHAPNVPVWDAGGVR
jgi:hypothetical protein